MHVTRRCVFVSYSSCQLVLGSSSSTACMQQLASLRSIHGHRGGRQQCASELAAARDPVQSCPVCLRHVLCMFLRLHTYVLRSPCIYQLAACCGLLLHSPAKLLPVRHRQLDTQAARARASQLTHTIASLIIVAIALLIVDIALC